MSDISGYGLRVIIRADKTFPQGFTVTEFADDADPIDNPQTELAQVAMGLNGNLVSWSSAQPPQITLNVLPNGQDDANLAVIAQRNITGRGQRPARDLITAVVMYPDGRQVTLARGRMLTATLAPGVASGGRIKTRSYAFAFESVTFGGVVQTVAGGVLGALGL